MMNVSRIHGTMATQWNNVEEPRSTESSTIIRTTTRSNITMCNHMANELVGSLIMPCTPRRVEKSTSGDGSLLIMVDIAVPTNMMECKIVDASVRGGVHFQRGQKTSSAHAIITKLLEGNKSSADNPPKIAKGFN